MEDSIELDTTPCSMWNAQTTDRLSWSEIDDAIPENEPGAQSMDEFFFLGTAVGAIFGVLHAPMVYRNRIADQGGSPQKAGYFAVWAVLLWTLFGAYVLALWLMGAAGMTFSHIRHTVRSKL